MFFQRSSTSSMLEAEESILKYPVIFNKTHSISHLHIWNTPIIVKCEYQVVLDEKRNKLNFPSLPRAKVQVFIPQSTTFVHCLSSVPSTVLSVCKAAHFLIIVLCHVLRGTRYYAYNDLIVLLYIAPSVGPAWQTRWLLSCTKPMAWLAWLYMSISWHLMGSSSHYIVAEIEMLRYNHLWSNQGMTVYARNL